MFTFHVRKEEKVINMYTFTYFFKEGYIQGCLKMIIYGEIRKCDTGVRDKSYTSLKFPSGRDSREKGGGRGRKAERNNHADSKDTE